MVQIVFVTSSACHGGALRCRNGHCVHPSNVCDGTDYCGDGRSTSNCSGTLLLSRYYFSEEFFVQFFLKKERNM